MRDAHRGRAWGCAAVLFALGGTAGCGGGTALAGDAGPTDGVESPDDGDDAGPADDATTDDGDDTAACTTDEQCDDGLRCSGFERCVGGTCVAGPAPDCDDGVDCSEDDCSETPPYCVRVPRDDRCPPGWACTFDGCVGECLDDGDCDDRDDCDGRESCVAGLCVPGMPPDCDDGVACTVDGCFDGTCRSLPDHGRCAPGELCDPVRGCLAAPSCASTDDCDDGDDCNGREACLAGTCVPGTPVDCDDGDDCNGLEWCLAGTCRPGRPLDCDDGDDCNGRETCRDLPECCAPAPEVCDGLDQDCDTTPDDGLSCFYLDDAVLRPYEGPACARDFYGYDDPRPDAANLAPDLAQPDTLVVLAHVGAGRCAGRAAVIAVADAADGSGGTARFEWTSDPIEVSPIVVSDDPDDCRHNDRLDAGRCDWDWTATTTDGVALGDYAGDFCLYLRVRTPVGLSALRVLDAAGPARSRAFESVFSVCRRTLPAAP